MEGPLAPGVPEYDPLLGAGQYNSKTLPCCRELELQCASSALQSALGLWQPQHKAY